MSCCNSFAVSELAAQGAAQVQAWLGLEKAAIGLNLSPFAKSVHAKGQIRWALSPATEPAALVDELMRELQFLAVADPEAVDTTLLVHPHVLQDFAAFNDFQDVVDALLVEMGLEGVLQVASFHPQFQFAEAPADDIAHATNRAPYPTLHLLREASIERAVEAFPQPVSIYERNIQTLRELGHDGLQRLLATR